MFSDPSQSGAGGTPLGPMGGGEARPGCEGDAQESCALLRNALCSEMGGADPRAHHGAAATERHADGGRAQRRQRAWTEHFFCVLTCLNIVMLACFLAHGC